MRTKAVATISLSGPLALQGRQAARGREMWASDDQIDLEIVDDGGDPATVSAGYQSWLSAGTDLMLGPYGSNLVRRVGPITSGEGVLLWNHGGSADDLTRPLVVQIPAPASSYFSEAVGLAHRLGLGRVVLARGPGRFAAAVAAGARERSAELGLTFRTVDLSRWSVEGAMDDTDRSFDFYTSLGFQLHYGGPDASFISFAVGDGFLNIIAQPDERHWSWWDD